MKDREKCSHEWSRIICNDETSCLRCGKKKAYKKPSLVEEALESQKAELLEKVKGIKKEAKKYPITFFPFYEQKQEGYNRGYDRALDVIINLIKDS